jgi:two-component system, NtrC family, response regulator HydG
MRARLTVETGDASPPVLDLSPTTPATLGRSRDSSLVIKDDLASRLHAKIYYEDSRWYVRDFGLNGTRVGGAKVSGAIELADGAVVQIGDTRLRFAVLAAGTNASISDPTVTSNIRGLGTASSIHHPPSARTGTVTSPDMRSGTIRNDTFTGTKAHLPLDRSLVTESVGSDVSASRLKVDELTALTRYMTAAVETTDPHELLRLTLRTILHQTTAKVAGYLSLDPTDPTPRVVLPEQASVDVTLSRKLTERVRTERRPIWLFADSTSAEGGTTS